MPEENSGMNYHRVFSGQEREKLKLGLTANSMDEKWNVYFFEDSFYMFRSWTGACIYDFGLSKTEDGYTIENARLNRNPDEYRATDNEYVQIRVSHLES